MERMAPRTAALWRCRHLIWKAESYLRESGYLRSLEQNIPVDRDGNPLAFLNYPVLALLEKRLKSCFRLLEFGSGYSTAFFAKRVGEVVSIEHEDGWLNRVRQLTSEFPNIHLTHVPLGPEYFKAAAQAGGKFQVILVDGRLRNECAMHSIPSLSEDGVLIWDDSARERYQDGINAVAALGFKPLRIEGLKPAGLGVDETTIFYREGNCLGL
jgi:hypothetical protein